jgi:hypothetical protein
MARAEALAYPLKLFSPGAEAAPAHTFIRFFFHPLYSSHF